MDSVPAVADWLTCGTYTGLEVGNPVGVKNQNDVDVQAISNLAIGFPSFWNYKLS